MRITSTDSALIQSCSFWTGDSAAAQTPYIRFHGHDGTKITIQNCDFVSRDAGVANCAIKQYNGNSAIDPQTIKPTLIENSTTNMELVDDSFRGSIINGNKIFNYNSDFVRYLNTSSTPTKQLDESTGIYRIAGGNGNNCNIIIPFNNPTSFLYNITNFKFLFANNIPIGATDTITFTVEDSNNQQILGTTNLTIGDYRGKIITLQYLGIVGNKETWNTFSS